MIEFSNIIDLQTILWLEIIWYKIDLKTRDLLRCFAANWSTGSEQLCELKWAIMDD